MAQSIHSLITVLQYAGKDEAIRRLHRLPQADVDRIVRALDVNLVGGDGYAARQAEDAIAEAFAFQSALELWDKEALRHDREATP